jgi:hypothetical protein
MLLVDVHRTKSIIVVHKTAGTTMNQPDKDTMFHECSIRTRPPAAYDTQISQVIVSVCRCVGVSVCRCVGVSVCRCVGVSVCRCVGVSVCRCVERRAVSVCRKTSISPASIRVTFNSTPDHSVNQHLNGASTPAEHSCL